jgi:hypothetical protein
VKRKTASRFVICIDNQGNPASLEVGKVYRTLPDRRAKGLALVRIIDESGEDYLYPADQFVPVRLTRVAADALSRA